MRPRMTRLFAVLALVLVLTGCGDGKALAGRWEGLAESAHWLLALRLQVDTGNTIHATALSVSVDGVSLPRRMELQTKIKEALVDQWPHAVIGKVDYKDHTITKAGGFAPLFMYDPKAHTMTFYFYAG